MLLITFMKCLYFIGFIILTTARHDYYDDEDDEIEPRVYRGDIVTERHRYKAQVSLQYILMDEYCKKKGSAHLCGGSLITRNTVVTAAHCFKTKQRIPNYVVAGDLSRYGENPGRQERQIQTYCIHPDFESRNHGEYFLYDFAAVRTFKEFFFNAYVGSQQLSLHKTFNGTSCQIVGWGQTGTDNSMTVGSDVLRRARATVLTQNACFRKIGDIYKHKIMLCVGNPLSRACKGDGPLICGFEVAGIPSFGTNICDNNGYFVFARVHIVSKWFDNYGETGVCHGYRRDFNKTYVPAALKAKSNRIYVEVLLFFIMNFVLLLT